jgi:hypothetical protein
MPIEVKRDIVRIAAPDFHRMDFDITGLAFAIHNEFGRLLHEKIYRNELVNRCRKAGLNFLTSLFEGLKTGFRQPQ